MRHAAITTAVTKYYEGKLRQCGATPRGCDWRDASSQTLRFDRLLEVLRSEPGGSLADIGCGYGGLLQYMRANGINNRYL